MIYSNRIPEPGEFYPLYSATGWNESLNLSPGELEQAIRNSYRVVSVYEQGQLIGFGRVVSDGVVYATLHDVMVMPKWQHQGIGSSIIRKLVRQCEAEGIRSIHLYAARGAESFYNNLGFHARPHDAPGLVYEKT